MVRCNGMSRGILFSFGPVMLLVCILCCSICCQQKTPDQNDKNLAEGARRTGEANPPIAAGTRSAAQPEATRDEPSRTPSRISDRAPAVAEFYRLVKTEDSSDGVGSTASLYVSKLPPEEQLKVGRSAVDDPDARMKSYGVWLLVELGYEDEAVPGFAELVTVGQDLTGLGWAWAHSCDDLVGLRMYVKASYYLLARLDGLTGSEREQAEQFLCSGGVVNPIAEFSRDAVVQRLRNIEERLKVAEHEQD